MLFAISLLFLINLTTLFSQAIEANADKFFNSGAAPENLMRYAPENKISNEKFKLTPEKSIKLEIPEPSDICFSNDGQTLWCVSDKTGFLYKLDLNGKIKEQYNYGLSDPEGVCIQDNFIWVLEEKRGVVNKIEDKITSRIKIIEKKKKFDLEGITYNSDTKEFYVTNKKSPTIYIYDSLFNLKAEKKLKYKGMSAICWDAKNKYIWVLSSKEKSIYILDSNFSELYKLEIDVKQAEGIAVSYEHGYIYVCSDRDNKLYIYKIPEFLFL